MKDHNHDLIDALAHKNDSVWRYQNYYLRSSQGCEHCESLWKTLQTEDERHVDMLRQEIKRHMDEGRFD